MNDLNTELDAAQLVAVQQEFERYAHQNGSCYWYDTELMPLLGYSDARAFSSIVNKAIASCASLDIDPLDDFIRCRDVDSNGNEVRYKFTRLACFLITIHADQNKREVRALQFGLAQMADTVMRQADFERLDTRSKLSSEEKVMASTAKVHGVENYAFFKDQGYRGMYNMRLSQLKERKGFDARLGTLYDRMGAVELAANLFRITQTTERIRNKGLRGQAQLEQAAHDVGRSVRKTVKENTGRYPEDIPLEDSEIKQIRQEGKKAAKTIKKIGNF